MVSSQLVPIIRRLEAMRADKTNDIQKRRFDINGRERCIVLFDANNGKYKLIDRQSDKAFIFDDIDYLAVEILELLRPRRSEYLREEKD